MNRKAMMGMAAVAGIAVLLWVRRNAAAQDASSAAGVLSSNVAAINSALGHAGSTTSGTKPPPAASAAVADAAATSPAPAPAPAPRPSFSSGISGGAENDAPATAPPPVTLLDGWDWVKKWAGG